MQPFYEKRYGSYYLKPDRFSSQIILMTDQVAMSYSKRSDGESILLKHGDPDDVNKWAAWVRKKYNDVGSPATAQTICVVVFPSTFEVEEINRCLDTAGYIGRLVALIEEGRIDANGRPVALP